ncbi:MAG: 3-methyl-2-oxobutanoate hydroxymethyltransferase [Acidobacteriota bacterium]
MPAILEAPSRGERVVMMTAYDFSQACLVEESGIDIALVGDSLAMVALGYDDTLSVTMEEMLHHVRAVRRGIRRALLVADMPYGSFHLGPHQAVENALRFVKEAGAQAVKIEGARRNVVSALVDAEIPVMAHLGLTPQSIHRFGGFKVQGRGGEARGRLLEAAMALEAAGAFSLVLECVPADLAAEVTEAIEIPTIGIGAGPSCNGQVLVIHDLLGLQDRLSPKFVRRYAELGTEARQALEQFACDVREGRFPTLEESYDDPSRAQQSERIRKIYG